MKIEIWAVGESRPAFVEEAVDLYSGRIRRYNPFEWRIIQPGSRKAAGDARLMRQEEGSRILGSLQTADHLILLDESGQTYTSAAFADRLQNWMNQSLKRLVFVIGGAYGFSDEVYGRADGKLSLSAMTLSHQVVRIIFLEQLYRGFTILRGEPYHNA